jgi:hypothetical protein
MGDGDFFDIHKIFQAPILPGIADVKRDLEAQAVELADWVVGLFQIRLNKMTCAWAWVCRLVLRMITTVKGNANSVVELTLIEVGAHMVFNGGVLQVFGLQVPHIELGAILGLSGLGPQFGNQMQRRLPNYGRARLVAKMSIHRYIVQGGHGTDRCQQGWQGGWGAHEFRIEHDLRFIFGPTALGAAGLILFTRGLDFFAAGLALLAVFSSALLTVWVVGIGYDCASRTFTRANVKNDRLGMTWCCTPEKKRSSPCVFRPALLTTTSSPTIIYSSFGFKKRCRKNDQCKAFHGRRL